MLARSLLYLHQTRRNLRLKPLDLQRLQEKKLAWIIKHAYENVPFYRKKFDKAGIKPSCVKSISDLSKLPITTKAELQASPLNDVLATNVDAHKCSHRTTGGSTGMPLTIFADDNTVDFEHAVWNRAYLENGVRIWDKRADIGDPRSFPRKLHWIQSLIWKVRYISIFDSAEAQLAILERYKPNAIRACPSSLEIMVDAFGQHFSNIKPRLIFTVGEVLDNVARKTISSTFGAELIDCYGASELRLLGWECHEHMGYHMNNDAVVMEFVDAGETVGTNENGEIVCTTLVNQAMPLIRYNVGDVGAPLEDPCSCGRSLPLMKIVGGRADDFLTASDGRIVCPEVFFPYPFENVQKIKQFRVIQETRDKLTIQLVLKESLAGKNQFFDKASREIRRLFGESMQVEFQVVEKIDRDPSGKIRKIVSKVPVRFANKKLASLENVPP